MKILIAFSQINPGHDAIGDYTVLLAGALSNKAEVSIFVEKSEVVSPLGVKLRAGFNLRSSRGVRNFVDEILKAQPDWLILQYNPFSWGRWGFNPWLPVAISDIKSRSKHTRIGLMVHEPFVRRENFKENPRFAIMTLWQRAQLWRLGRLADRVFFSIEAWSHRFESWFSHARPMHLPVGSNIPIAHTRRVQARRELRISPDKLVFFNFGMSHPARLVSPLNAVFTRLGATCDAVLLIAGTGADATSRLLEGLPVRSLGAQPASEISKAFLASDIYLCPYADGVSTRRGSFMAGISHGIATITTLGPLTDSLLQKEAGISFLGADVNNLTDFVAKTLTLTKNAPERARLGRAAQELYTRNFAWERIAGSLLSSLN